VEKSGELFYVGIGKLVMGFRSSFEGDIMLDSSFNQILIFEFRKDYKAYTNYAFLLSEAILVSQLLYKGLTFKQIRQYIIDQDILQMRSIASREGALRILKKLLDGVPKPYIEFLAMGNSDIRRYSLLFLTLRVNRLLREFIAEVLLDKLKSLDFILRSNDLRVFFELKREQETTLSLWSNSTYQKACSNTILILVRAGLLTIGKNRGMYEIQSMPLPMELKQQLLLDDLEPYVKLMLN
jgi:hypothetical protein